MNPGFPQDSMCLDQPLFNMQTENKLSQIDDCKRQQWYVPTLKDGNCLVLLGEQLTLVRKIMFILAVTTLELGEDFSQIDWWN